MIILNRESFSFDDIPDSFGLKISHEEKVNSTYVKLINKKLLTTHSIIERISMCPNSNELYGVDIIYFKKK